MNEKHKTRIESHIDYFIKTEYPHFVGDDALSIKHAFEAGYRQSLLDQLRDELLSTPDSVLTSFFISRFEKLEELEKSKK